MKYCGNCGDIVEDNERFCNKCGNPINLINNSQNNLTPHPIEQKSFQLYKNFQQINNQYKDYNNKDSKKYSIIGICVGFGIILVFFVIFLIYKKINLKYYFDVNTREDSNETIQLEGESASIRRGKYSTAIIYDNKYSGVSINDDIDAYKLIEKDSVQQKNNCPSEIRLVENDIISKYGITAVNLCEMDIDFAKEIENVIKKVYEEYPSARGYLTNLSLANVAMFNSYIAAFMPTFRFATSNTSSTYPWVIKTQVLLNTSYFLNHERLQATVSDGSNSGHFPSNATIYSPIAHEFGHYLSFLAMMKDYDIDSILIIDDSNLNDFYNIYSDFVYGIFSLQMIEEAYEKYRKDTNTSMSIDEWRGTISKYALAKDNSGNYIYDETIAESFHDVYLNGDNAKDASKYVIEVLKSKLGN